MAGVDCFLVLVDFKVLNGRYLGAHFLIFLIQSVCHLLLIIAIHVIQVNHAPLYVHGSPGLALHEGAEEALYVLHHGLSLVAWYVSIQRSVIRNVSEYGSRG